jgi:membrane metallo-endopeptidase-like protein 1
MDLSINPCDNFYRFSCGNFIKNTIIPDDGYKVDEFTEIDNKLLEKLRISIEDGITENDLRAFKLLQTYYKTCMNISNHISVF